MSRPASAEWPVAGLVLSGLVIIAVLLGGFGTWSVFSSLSGAIMASGRVEVARNRQIVQHPDGGVVDAVLVDEGDVVVRGDVLIRLDPGVLTSRLAVVEAQLFALLARQDRLRAERDGTRTIMFDPILTENTARSGATETLLAGQNRLFQVRKTARAQEINQLEKRRAQIEDQIDGIAAQKSASGEQLALIDTEMRNQQGLLDRGLTQTSRVLGLRREMARLQGLSGELAAQMALSAERITEIGIEILKVESRLREAAITGLRDIEIRLIELTQERATLRERMDRLEIRAPVSGIVYGLSVFAERSVIQPAQPVLYLVPQDRPMVVAARVQPIHVDQVFPGQAVDLRFPGFDKGAAPSLRGRVVRISADAFSDEATQSSFFRAQIEIVQGEEAKLSRQQVIRPGLPVEVFIRTQDRSPITFLLMPLTNYFRKAFRES